MGYIKESERSKELQYYYDNKQRVLEYQIARLMKKYREDEEYRAKSILRSKTRYKYNFTRIDCSICFSKKDLHFHHENYNQLDAVVLCKRCHDFIHKLSKL